MLLTISAKNNYGASSSNLPTFNDDPVITTNTHLIPAYNFSFYPTRKKLIPTDALESVPSCSTDSIEVPKASPQKYSTGSALLYISSDNVRAAGHEAIAHALIEQANQQSVGAIGDVMRTVLKTQYKPFYLVLLVPGYIVRGECLAQAKEKCKIRRISERAVVTLGEGVRRKEIAYQQWLAQSSAIGDNGGKLCIGIPDVMSSAVQLTDVVGIKNETLLYCKSKSRDDPDSFCMRTTSVQLSASTCDPEKTAALLRKQLDIYNGKLYTYRQLVQELVDLVAQESFLGTVVLTLRVNSSKGWLSTHKLTAFREGRHIKGYKVCPEAVVRYQVSRRDPFCM